jgi:hypothetical protein
VRVTALFVVCVIGCHPDGSPPPDAARLCSGDFVASGSRLHSVAHADFNSDGLIDLVASGDAGISVFTGLADGSFRDPVVVMSGLRRSIAAADFDADGHVDVVVTAQDTQGTTPSGVLSWFAGNGDGTFGPETVVVRFPFPSGDWSGGANHLAIGDLDGDTRTDVVLTARDGIHLLLGNGDGTFRVAATYAVGTYASEVASADFNQDGVEDIVVADPGNHCLNYADVCDPEASGGLYLLLGLGSAMFEVRVVNSDIRDARGNAGGATSVSVADLDRDGAPDVVTGNYLAPTTVLLARHDGTFDPARSLESVEVNFYVETALADLDLDGSPDLIEVDTGHNGLVHIWHGRGDGGFSSEADYVFPRTYGGFLTVSKLDTANVGADRATDVVVTSESGVNGYPQYGLGLLPATCFQQ